MIKKLEAARRKVIDLLDKVTSPGAMSQKEALECLEELFADIEGRVDALTEEIKREGVSG